MRCATPQNENYEITGWRFIAKWDSARPVIGDLLPNSYTWDGDEPTDIELGGTCAFNSRIQAEKYAQHSKGCGWIVKMGGQNAGAGDEDNEIIIANAIGIEIQSW